MNQSSVTKNPVSDGVGRALEISLRGVEELLPQDEWIKKLARSEATGQPLRIKLGLDPTAPDIHIGHTVVLNKMRQLQDLGHQVIFLIGDFTSLILRLHRLAPPPGLRRPSAPTSAGLARWGTPHRRPCRKPSARNP